MKKYFILVLAVLLTMGLASSALAGTANGSGITSNAHDLRGDTTLGPATGTGEICVVCHTPHNAMTIGLLWNHAATTNTTFTMYSSVLNPLDGVEETAGEPTGVSKMCLGCHDGSTGLDAYGAVSGTDLMGGFDSTLVIGSGGDLSTTHPISIDYPDGLLGTSTDAEINVRTATFASASGTTGAISTVLQNGILQCSSCHDVHNGPETVANNLLRGQMSGSRLCLVCHDK